jgi:hypothetical protein
MTSRRPITRLLLLTGVALTALTASSPSSKPAALTTVADAQMDSIRPPEVRLRKLHLVRPDLIPYPIEYEVVC